MPTEPCCPASQASLSSTDEAQQDSTSIAGLCRTATMQAERHLGLPSQLDLADRHATATVS